MLIILLCITPFDQNTDLNHLIVPKFWRKIDYFVVDSRSGHGLLLVIVQFCVDTYSLPVQFTHGKCYNDVSLTIVKVVVAINRLVGSSILLCILRALFTKDMYGLVTTLYSGGK